MIQLIRWRDQVSDDSFKYIVVGLNEPTNAEHIEPMDNKIVQPNPIVEANNEEESKEVNSLSLTIQNDLIPEQLPMDIVVPVEDILDEEVVDAPKGSLIFKIY